MAEQLKTKEFAVTVGHRLGDPCPKTVVLRRSATSASEFRQKGFPSLLAGNCPDCGVPMARIVSTIEIYS